MSESVWVACSRCGADIPVAFVGDDGRCWECRGFHLPDPAADHLIRGRAEQPANGGTGPAGRYLGERRDV